MNRVERVEGGGCLVGGGGDGESGGWWGRWGGRRGVSGGVEGERAVVGERVEWRVEGGE